MNKAAEIRAMFIECPHWTNRQIADAVGVHDAYVRATRQRLNPEHRERNNRSRIARQNSGDKEAARDAGRVAYQQARSNGATCYEATKKRFNAYSRTLFSTGSAAAAREAWRE